MSLTQQIKAEARRLGFSLAGITTPDPPPHYPGFEAWLAAGRHGEMGYLASERARQRRADPRQILPECRSILVLGMRYPSPDSALLEDRAGQGHPERSEGSLAPEKQILRSAQDDALTEAPACHSERSEESPRGRLASYAWGEDYHDLLPERLQALVAYLEAQAGHPVPNRWYTDTGPILERDLAQRAGLGWIGKNTCLIQPRYGSYFLLAEILLGLELESDPPFLPDYCGSCTRCLEACPTACILPDRTIDARRCISYLTIELKGSIPEELRSQIGGWVFGCDVCQEVCPWNRRFADPAGDMERQAVQAFAPRPQAPRPNLIEELALTPQEFGRKYKGSPLKRAKRRGYLRNVAIALGNACAGQPDPAAASALGGALREDPEPLVRSHAAWALGRMGGDQARQSLVEAVAAEGDPSVLAEIQAALGNFKDLDNFPPS